MDLADLATLRGHYGTTGGVSYEDGNFDFDVIDPIAAFLSG